MRKAKILATATLWAALIWFLSLTILTKYRILGSLANGLTVGVIYFLLRSYSYRKAYRQRAIDYEALRAEVRSILSDVLCSPDEGLIRELQTAIKRIDKAINHYRPLDLRKGRPPLSQEEEERLWKKKA
jgi:hypothetical protein